MDPSTSNPNNDVIEISDDSSDDGEKEAYKEGSGSSNMALENCTISVSDEDAGDDTTTEESDDDDVQVIDVESESEPELECDLWDNDCIVSKLLPKTKLLEGIHHVLYISPPAPNNVKKMKLSAELNAAYHKDTDLYKNLKENFTNNLAYEENNVCEVIVEPWKVLVMNDLLSNPSIFEELIKECYELKWNIRNMDLYEFFQSEDLKNLTSEYIKMVFEFIKGDLMTWAAELTGLELVEASATCSFYSDTDFLLCHDDQKENRAVAYVLYFTGGDGWSVDWGGSLQLFSRDENNEPKEVTKSIYPKNNQLVLFPVSSYSYHQVEEVQCKNFPRFSINGWFHTKEPLKFEEPQLQLPKDGLYHADTIENIKPIEVENLVLKDWIFADYLDGRMFDYIHSYIEENSESALSKYFTSHKMELLLKDLQTDLPWAKPYAPNRRHYEYIGETNRAKLPETLQAFVNLLSSTKFVDCLNKYTGLELVNFRWELQRWHPGCYSLLCDENRNRLDVIIYLGDCDIVGGKMQYVTLEEEVQTALITICSETNNMNLVYGDTARYMSLISKYSKSKQFYIFFASYYEADQ